MALEMAFICEKESVLLSSLLHKVHGSQRILLGSALKPHGGHYSEVSYLPPSGSVFLDALGWAKVSIDLLRASVSSKQKTVWLYGGEGP
jgi:hypothetical protein